MRRKKKLILLTSVASLILALSLAWMLRSAPVSGQTQPALTQTDVWLDEFASANQKKSEKFAAEMNQHIDRREFHHVKQKARARRSELDFAVMEIYGMSLTEAQKTRALAVLRREHNLCSRFLDAAAAN